MCLHTNIGKRTWLCLVDIDVFNRVNTIPNSQSALMDMALDHVTAYYDVVLRVFMNECVLLLLLGLFA